MPRIPHLSDRLNLFVRHVQGCHACPSMEGRRRVLTEKNGNALAEVMFVAEAPGRHGADRTGIPIHGDATGINFESLLKKVGWEREDVFVTNAVLCNPRDEAGNNRPPTQIELENCSFNLEETIRIVNPRVVVTLGAKALLSISLVEAHGLILNQAVAKPIPWFGRILFPLYHQSPRALLHRDMAQQTKDFLKLKSLVENPS